MLRDALPRGIVELPQPAQIPIKNIISPRKAHRTPLARRSNGHSCWRRPVGATKVISFSISLSMVHSSVLNLKFNRNMLSGSACSRSSVNSNAALGRLKAVAIPAWYYGLTPNLRLSTLVGIGVVGVQHLNDRNVSLLVVGCFSRSHGRLPRAVDQPSGQIASLYCRGRCPLVARAEGLAAVFSEPRGECRPSAANRSHGLTHIVENTNWWWVGYAARARDVATAQKAHGSLGRYGAPLTSGRSGAR
jgi:hypothetical protein